MFQSFREKVRVGENVNLFLTNGQEKRGRVRDISDDHVVLCTSRGEFIAYQPLIGGWEVENAPVSGTSLTATSCETGSRLPTIAEDPPYDASQWDDEPERSSSPTGQPLPPNSSVTAVTMAPTVAVNAIRAADPAHLEVQPVVEPKPTPTLSAPPEFLLQLIELVATCKGAAQQANLILKPYLTDFPVALSLGYRDRLEAERQWNTLDQRYKNAVREGEQIRFGPLIEAYGEFYKKFPMVDRALFNTGCLQAKLERCAAAMRSFEAAAESADGSAASYNAAYCALILKDRARACWSLGRYCAQQPNDKLDEAWYVLIRLVGEIQAHEVWTEMANLICGGKGSLEAAPCMVKAIAYFLYVKGHADIAAAALQRSREPFSDPLEFRSVCTPFLVPLLERPSPEWKALCEQHRNEKQQRIQAEADAAWQERRREQNAKALLEPTGHITHYKQDGGFGKVRDLDNRTVFFHISFITDKELYHDLGAALVEPPIAVTCEYVKGPRGLAAKNIRRCRTTDEKAEETNGSVEAATNRARSGLALPKGNNPYAQARRFFDTKEWERAEPLYRKAIKQNDNFESAVKDLASLLKDSQRHQEAIALLKEHLPAFRNRLPALNILTVIYQHMGYHAEAIPVLNEVRSLVPRQRKPQIAKRIVLSQFKLQDYEGAMLTTREILRDLPQDVTALSWKKALDEAKQSGRYSQIDSLFIMSGILSDLDDSDLSPVLEFAMSNCEYIGLRKEDWSGTLSEETVTKVENFIHGNIGRARPRERAQCYLTAARVLRDIQSEDHTRMRNFLRQYCAHMGDCMALEGRKIDVVRTYYAEAFSIAQEWGTQLDVKAAQFLLAYVRNQAGLVEVGVNKIGAAVSEVFNRGFSPVGFWHGLLGLFVANKIVAQQILPAIYGNPKAYVEALVFLKDSGIDVAPGKLSIQDFLMVWETARTTRSRDYESWHQSLKALRTLQFTISDLENLSSVLNSAKRSWLCALDSQRLESLASIAGLLCESSRQTAYDSRERPLSRANVQSKDLMTEIKESPTRVSLGAFYPLLEALLKLTEKANEDLLNSTAPRVELALLVTEEAASADQKISLRMEITNGVNCSPIDDICLTIPPAPGRYEPTQHEFRHAQMITGGERFPLPCALWLEPDAIRSRALTVEVYLSYRDCRGQTIEHPSKQLALRLYPASEFREFDNPFNPWVTSGPVTDPKMFYGREEILGDICDALTKADAKCFVLYGQARSGKTSVVTHLQRRLSESGRFICFQFSLGNVMDSFSLPVVLYRVLSGLKTELETLSERNIPVPEFQFPALRDFGDAPSVFFIEALQRFQRACRQTPGWEGRKFVVIIDEFTYLYGQIVRGRVADTFMKSWKSLLEAGVFSAVLVGQDMMPKFRDKYSNEFGSVRMQRLTYLSRESARQLIEDPIRVGGESRLRGLAVERVFELTAGNPFYEQILGDRLVAYMNHNKLLYATEIEVNDVAGELIRGDQPLVYKDFENLITAGDADIEPVPPSETLTVLQALALVSGATGGAAGACPREALASQELLQALTPGRVDEILSDLVIREVVERTEKGDLRIKVELFRAWLLYQSGATIRPT